MLEKSGCWEERIVLIPTHKNPLKIIVSYEKEGGQSSARREGRGSKLRVSWRKEKTESRAKTKTE